jgi:hypothetical protein
MNETETDTQTETQAANETSDGPIPLQAVPATRVPLQVVPVQAAPGWAAPVEDGAAKDGAAKDVVYEGTVIEGTADEDATGEAVADEAPVAGVVAVEDVAAKDMTAKDVRPLADRDEGPLLADTEELRSDWQRIKVGFVDNPRASVAQAETVIDEAVDRLVAALRARQDRTRDTWDRDGRDTESLRQALLTYQALFYRVTDL